MTVGSLFAGIGGFDLGLERAGFEIKWQVEIDDYCRSVLAKHWPHVKRYGDIRSIDWGTVPRVDLLCGGFPCQDLSTAGKKQGLRDGTRSGLWAHYAQAIRILRPRFVLVENVSGLLDNHALGRVLGDLAECGFDAEWSMFPASSVGFLHQRQRVWIVAYPQCLRRHPGKAQIFINYQRLSDKRGTDALRWMVENAGSRDGSLSRDLRNGNGLPGFMDRLRGLGNAIVPQIAEWLGRHIKEVMT